MVPAGNAPYESKKEVPMHWYAPGSALGHADAVEVVNVLSRIARSLIR